MQSYLFPTTFFVLFASVCSFCHFKRLDQSCAGFPICKRTADCTGRNYADGVLRPLWFSTNPSQSADTKTVPSDTIKNDGAPYSKSSSTSATNDFVDAFCRATNDLFRSLTVPVVRNYVETQPARMNMSFFETITSPPQYPGIPRPVTLTIIASVPTFLGWYGYYKFSVEQELFEDELRREGRVTGCGGYGTLLPFVFLFLAGTATAVLPFMESLSTGCFEAGGLWILLGQINLYRRVNELCEKEFGETPLYSWWAVLPPPLDVIVGLRQVHFLAKYWAKVRGYELEEDVVAEELFPFISSERFTLKQLVREPRRWFWFTKDAKDFF